MTVRGARDGLLRNAWIILVCAFLADCVELDDPGDAEVRTTWGESSERLDDAGVAPEVAVDPTGDALVIWTKGDGVWSSRFTDDAGWGRPERVRSAPGLLPNAAVGVDANGNAFAAWSEVSLRDEVLSGQSAREGAWEASKRISNPSDEATTPALAVNEDGDAVAIWVQFDGVSFALWSNRYAPGTGWLGPTRLEMAAARPQEPQVAIDPGANAVAVWYAVDGGTFDVWSSHSSSEGIWATAVQVGTGGRAITPHVGVDRDGNAVAVWVQSTLTRDEIWSSRYSLADGWATPESIDHDDRWSSQGPHIAVRPDGSAVAVWSKTTQIGRSIWSNQYAPLVGWGEDAQRIGADAGFGDQPRVASGPAGKAVVVWRQADGIWSNHYSPQRGWGTPGALSSNPTGGALDPRVGIDLNGRAIAVWAVLGGSTPGIWVNRFE